MFRIYACAPAREKGETVVCDWVEIRREYSPNMRLHCNTRLVYTNTSVYNSLSLLSVSHTGCRVAMVLCEAKETVCIGHVIQHSTTTWQHSDG
jgi:hypothetical protein